MSRAVFISGRQVDLVCMTRTDAEAVHRWNSDMDILADEFRDVHSAWQSHGPAGGAK